jgi:hypothetical protein
VCIYSVVSPAAPPHPQPRKGIKDPAVNRFDLPPVQASQTLARRGPPAARSSALPRAAMAKIAVPDIAAQLDLAAAGINGT